jgi:hypothetical protein
MADNDRKKRIRDVVCELPPGLSLRDFLEHPLVQGLEIDFLTLREIYEFYDLYPPPGDLGDGRKK